MLDIQKVKFFKILATVLGIVLIFLIGFGFGARGQSQSSPKTITKKSTTTKNSNTQDGSLTQNYVEDFLMVYYTKKDLGENRNRYLPFMTEAAYQQEVNSEEEPATQAYKGYVVDTKLKSSTIYIDTTNHVVLTQVSYTQTQLQKKNNYANAQKDVLSNSTIRIRYVKQDGKYLVSQIEPILIVDTLTAGQEAGIPTLNQPKNTQTTEGGN